LNSYLKSVDTDWYKQRLSGAMLWALAGFFLLFTRFFYLQIVEGEEFKRLSENNCIRLQTIDPPRGLIFDSKGSLLVDNRPSFDLGIIVQNARFLDQTVAILAEHIQESPEALMDKIRSSRGVPPHKPIILKSDIGRDLLAVVEVHKFELPGVEVIVRPVRNYAFGSSAVHLIGYVGQINAAELKSERYDGYNSGDLIGKFGVESVYERFLRGEAGGRQIEVNATGRIARVLKTVNARSGHNVYLSIDQNLQEKAESLLAGQAGAVAAMDPRSGRILALSSSPSFDPNSFAAGMSRAEWETLISNDKRPLENKAIQGEYPPASTFKIITAMAGLEEGVITEHTKIFCNGAYRFGDRDFRCWKKEGHGWMNVVDALAESCDVFFYEVGHRLGVDRIARYAKACGLGTKTRIGLDHEGAGLVPTSAWKKQRFGVSWRRGETLSVAIGQGFNLATPLQMLSVAAAVANEGQLKQPYVVDAVEAPDGTKVYQAEEHSAGRIPASEKTLAIIKKGLWKVVNGNRGTARIAKIQGIQVSGKTGTAQVVSRKSSDSSRKIETRAHLKSHAWFVAYAPSENPVIAVSVIVEHGEHGSSAAAPIARDVIAAYLGKKMSQDAAVMNGEVR
jgi:penicillin-binding protein 2